LPHTVKDLSSLSGGNEIYISKSNRTHLPYRWIYNDTGSSLSFLDTESLCGTTYYLKRGIPLINHTWFMFYIVQMDKCDESHSINHSNVGISGI